MKKDGAHYMPSNGKEGRAFDKDWCNHCVHDSKFREDPDQFDGCEILADMEISWQRDEWVYKDGKGCCAAYQEDPNHPLRCPYTFDLFPAEAA